MMILPRRMPGSLRLAILTALLAMLTVGLALGDPRMLPWTPRWYPPAHAVLEACSVVLTLLIFAIGVHGAGRRIPSTVALLSSSALAVALLGIGHLLSIPVLAGSDAPIGAASGAAFWVVAHGTSALSLLAASLLPVGHTVGRRAHALCVLGAVAVAAWGYWLVLVRPELVPPTFVSGTGMTGFTLAFETALVGVNAGAALILVMRARRKASVASCYLAAAAAVTGLSGINFTLHVAPDDLSDLLAHLYKLVALLCLHRALFADAIRLPYRRLLAKGRNEARRVLESIAGNQHAPVTPTADDTLAALPDRQHALDVLGKAIDAARCEGGSVAVIVLDIDGFRKINSHYGWGGGDEVLRECVARLSGRLGAGDTLAHQSGNEFIVVRRHADRDSAAAFARGLQECMRLPFAPGGHSVCLSVSVGIAVLPAEPCQASQLLHMAQVASACARHEGPAHLCFYTPRMGGAIRERVDLETMLYRAIERKEFVLQYQPRISMKDGRMVGVEALVRWRHPELGLLAPGRFIPLAEESGLINELDLWVLREACTRAAAWRAQGLFSGRVSVNLSARQFQQAGLAQRVRAALEDSGLAPEGLELEITESTVMHDTEDAADVLRSLRELGVTVSIDDFGTGYSSLSYLKRFPLDVLKIDRAFVRDMESDATGVAIIRAIITLAHSLGLSAVAEGVETEEQVAFLKENGCDEIQGYYFSRPVWPDEVSRLLEEEALAVCSTT
ncbi:bifunctional diguanylate cyclase/phosphodiesterase [Massilia sp. BSC265]|uniref:putative bifunctional diguanylate cyclase/phosphodiesterase n=1 Tax=Massilia sp. BSC265 TaxID=1549812 RepID=UPI001376D76A|nr:EAL domain-containing protein [Massilia sp. BSC265]